MAPSSQEPSALTKSWQFLSVLAARFWCLMEIPVSMMPTFPHSEEIQRSLAAMGP